MSGPSPRALAEEVSVPDEVVIDGTKFTLFKDYDKGKFSHLSFSGKVEYLQKRVGKILIRPCREAMRSALKTDLGLVLATAVCAGISAAGTFLKGCRARRGEDKQFFVEFVTQYMNLAHEKPIPAGTSWPEWLYSHVRCGLAHNFAIESGGVEYEATSYVELKPCGPEISPLELLEDFSRGLNKYFGDVRDDGEANGKGILFKNRFDEVFHD
jgi:hypothetical protein